MGANCCENESNNKNQTELNSSNKIINIQSKDKFECSDFYCCFKEKLCDISITYFFPDYENVEKKK